MKIINIYCSLLITVLLSVGLAAQPTVKNEKILYEILTYAQENSIKKEEIDWETVTKKVEGIHKAEGLIQATQALLIALGDFHGRIWYNQVPYYGDIKSFTPTTMKLDSATISQYRMATLPFKGDYVKNQYGYIRIPTIRSSPDDAKHANTINDFIVELTNNKAPAGWILDLRLNGGGTMYPMLSGLNAFYKEGESIGSFIDPKADFKQSWTIKKGDLCIDTFQVSNNQIKEFVNLANSPVVVLLSASTSSSGEITAISFKNRPNTYFIGEETAGYTTTVSWRELGDGFVFQLTESWYADREDTLYKGTPVQPDLYMEGGNNFANLEEDQVILKAIEWLVKNNH